MTINPMVCKGCGQPLYGSYIQALGANWHPEHFTCAACGRLIGSEGFTPHENRPYHTACYENTFLPRCAHCHQPLTGRYVTDQQKRQYHEQCYSAVAPRCAYCNKPLVERYLVDQWGTMYCSEHEKEYPRCAFCGRLVPPREQETRADSIRCATCRSSAIETTQKATPLFHKAMQWAEGKGLLYHNLSLAPELCSREQMTRYLQERSTIHPHGITRKATYSLNGQVTHSVVKGVAILVGLPSLLFQGVSLHELGHVWCVIQGIDHLPPWAEEGFCELLSYRYYSELNTFESLMHAKNIEQHSDPIYGGGFRRVRAITVRVGWQRLIETLQRSKQLPN